MELVEEFEKHELPLAALCIGTQASLLITLVLITHSNTDMDWHREGWTGYSWNQELIPNPSALLAFMQRKNVRVSLNLHPADGCQPHEDAYADLAKFLGRDPLPPAGREVLHLGLECAFPNPTVSHR